MKVRKRPTPRLRPAAVLVALIAAGFVWAQPATADAARVKDIAYVQGVRDNQLLGYGLVVGLDGTGDSGQATFTVQSTASMLARLGIKVDSNRLRTKNVAAVMVTADLPPFAQSGQRLDIVVSSLGNATSLSGGTLLMTPLAGPDGEIYAMAQGAVSIGGYDVSTATGQKSKNHVTAGAVPNGAIVERPVGIELAGKTEIRLILREADFTTAVEMARSISDFLAGTTEQPLSAGAAGAAGGPDEANGTGAVTKPKPTDGLARAVDASTVLITVPDEFKKAIPQFISMIELLDVQTSRVARVVVNERTGTVVLGGDVRVSEVAVAHGALEVSVDTDLYASQPNPLGRGETAILPDQQVDVREERGTLRMVGPSASIGDVVSALNAIGATPRDLIAILQAIKAAGALEAELVIQ